MVDDTSLQPPGAEGLRGVHVFLCLPGSEANHSFPDCSQEKNPNCQPARPKASWLMISNSCPYAHSNPLTPASSLPPTPSPAHLESPSSNLSLSQACSSDPQTRPTHVTVHLFWLLPVFLLFLPTQMRAPKGIIGVFGYWAKTAVYSRSLLMKRGGSTLTPPGSVLI